MSDQLPYWTALPEDCKTKVREELVIWFRDRAPSFVEGYIGSVNLLHAPSFPGRVHFICHVVRDIYRFLPKAFDVKSLPRPAEVFPPMVKKLAEVWQKFPPDQASDEYSRVSGNVLVSSQVHRYTKKIVDKSNNFKKQNTVGEQLAIALFRSLEQRPDDFCQPWIIDAFDAEYDFFVKRAHLAVKVDKIPTDDGLIEHFESFERAFHSLVGPYFSGKEELDAILYNTNAARD